MDQEMTGVLYFTAGQESRSTAINSSQKLALLSLTAGISARNMTHKFRGKTQIQIEIRTEMTDNSFTGAQQVWMSTKVVGWTKTKGTI